VTKGNNNLPNKGIIQYRKSQAKWATFFFTVITCKRKSMLCHETNVAPIKEAFQHVAKQHTLRIHAFVLLPDHIHGIWTFDVKVRHE